MTRERLSMRKISEVLRLRLEQKLSVRQISRSCDLARSTVADYIERAAAAGIGCPLPDGMDEEKLGKLLFPVQASKTGSEYPVLDMIYIRNEMRRKHVTLQLLWEEYKAHTPEGYSYSQYCQLYRAWLGKQAISLRQEHRAGEKLFIDYAGDTVPIHDPITGDIREAHLFVSVLGCSNYTYAEATLSETLPDWVDAQIHALEFYEGVPQIVVPDNAKAVVTTPCWYDPDINHTFQEVSEHYGFAVIPARSRRPKDKAKVECGVLIAERWILAALRHRKFFSLGELNAAIAVLLKRLNEHPFKKFPGNRREVFDKLERGELKALPERRYELAWWKNVGVNIDYHVDVDGHYYSVPYNLIHCKVEARYTRTTVELFHKGKRVAVHVRSYEKGRHTTISEHRPPAHKGYLEWTPERITSWARKIGVNVEAAVSRIMSSSRLPEHGYRPCLGVIRLGSCYGNDRLDRACLRAIRLNIVGYRHIVSILKTGRDKASDVEESKTEPVTHDNLRGAEYYKQETGNAL